jgi:hypothetical protein
MNVIKRIKLNNITQNIRNNQKEYSKGIEILEKSFWRISHDDILISLLLKFRAIFIRKFIDIIIKIRKKISKQRLKKYFKRWKHISALPDINKNMKEIKQN